MRSERPSLHTGVIAFYFLNGFWHMSESINSYIIEYMPFIYTKELNNSLTYLKYADIREKECLL